MAAEASSLRLTDAYRARLLQTRQRTLALAIAQWRRVLSIEDLDGSYRAWLAAAATLVSAAQREGVIVTGAYLASFVASETGGPVQPPGLPADRYAGHARDGRPVHEELLAPLITVRLMLAQMRGREQALRSGLARATRIISAEALAAPRQALADEIHADDRIVGWRRVTSGNACGACLAAATGAIHADSVVLDVHDHCACTAEPVIRDVPDRAIRPTGRDLFDGMAPAEQDALFAGRGGAEKAELIRSGQVPFDALIDRSPQRWQPDQLTETPLKALA